MSLTANNLQNVVDLPVWEWLRFAPASTTATSATTSADNTDDSRYIYYINGSSLFRYDTISDGWMQLQTATTAPVTAASIKYSDQAGFRSRIISSVSGSFVGAGLQGNIFKNKPVRIYSGKGVGQQRTITDVSNITIYDAGVATATTSTTQIQDTTKKWKFNQWIGYQVSVVFGTGAVQRRKVLYNTTDTLFFSDANYQQIEPWNNVAFSAVAPNAAPVSTAGSQTHYQIESSTFTLDSNWTTVPDNTSRFVIETGGIWMLSSAAAAPFFTLQFYDIAADAWTTKTATGGLYLAALGTDFAFEKITDAGGIYVTGSVTSATNRIIRYNDNLSSSLDRWVNYEVRITDGIGMGQRRRVVANTTGSIEVESKWVTTPDTGSKFAIVDDRRNAFIAGGALSTLLNYNLESDLSAQGPIFDYGLARNMSVGVFGFEAIAVSTATRGTGGITAVNSVPTVKGTNYVVGDILTLTTGGTNGKVIVESISAGGLVETVSLLAAGANYTVGTGRVTTGGTGTGCTIEITSIGTVGRVTTAINHNFRIDDSITFAGATESAWNTTYTILGVDSITAFDIIITATANATATTSQTTSILVDSAQNWDVNEHVGKIIQISTSGTAPTTQIRRITANTSNTITLQSTITSATNGTSRYIISDAYAYGKDTEDLIYNKINTGYATGGSTTTLIDSTKNWDVNQWAGYRFRIVSGTGRNNEIAITSNTANTLTFGTQTFSPDISTKYIIMDTFGLCTAGSTTTLQDTTKIWVTNRWAGKRVRITSGTGAGTEFIVTSNTSNTLTFATGTSPGTDSTYTILGIPARGAGIQMFHIWNSTKFTEKGKYLILPRGGGSNQIDKYDLTKDLWIYGQFLSPINETLTTGTMYAYDGEDRIYFTKDATGRVYVYNILTNMVQNAGQIPYGMGTALIGNRMDILVTADNLKYLYLMRHSSNEYWRQLIFYT